MEQLIAVFGLDWRLLIAQVVNFVILLGVLSYFLYTPILKMLDDRKKKIEKGLQDAEAARLAREAASAERSGIIIEAQHEAARIVARAEEGGKRTRATIVKTAQERADAVIKDSHLQAAEVARRALAESEKEIARVALRVAEKILQKS